MGAVWPVTHTRGDEGAMTVGGLDVRALAAEFGTPLFVVDEEDLRSRARAFATHFADAFAAHGATCDVYYASKALLASRIAGWMEEDGLGIDVASGGELELALRGGMPAHRITLHGNNKSDAELTRALEVGVGHIVVDSTTEIEVLSTLAVSLGRVAPVLVRVTTGVHAGGHEYIATSHEDQKFGLSLASGAALDALRAVHAAPGLELRGIHTHIGSQILSIDAFRESAERMLGLRAAFAAETGVEVPEVDLGGGYAIAYTADAEALDPAVAAQEIADAVAAALATAGGSWPALSIEPGRSIAGPAGITLYTVGVVKHVSLEDGGERQYVAVDGGMSDNPRTIMYGAEYSAELAGRQSQAAPALSRVVGKHCESGDIVVRDVELPADTARGDLLAVAATGAYGRSMASNYNAVLRPPVVAVRDGAAQVLIRRETLDDLLSWDVAPS
ncbi:diaminopimelate decarboxylase [Demequina sp. NBRC 110056]|uniref:diaminopimelate decarboxylase n=1 Tax=Demequina sp. NBRC 110056 TaxID=1570345 RepID=UPI001F204A89|nr:diaminopimelate decarboxylase [Demequina sp. NBRC 110056]